MRTRPAREADLEQLAEIHACAYPEPGGADHHARCLTHNAFGGLDRVRVAERDGRVVGHAALFLLQVWLGGRLVPVGGIGSLAVAPEARREGVAQALLLALDAEIAAEAGALALLYPFRQRFYARLGYAAVSPLVTLEIDRGALGPLLPLEDSASFSTIRLEGPRVHEARALYEALGRATSGRVVRSEARWMKLFAREYRHWLGVLSPTGRLEGYASFSYDGGAVSRDQTLVVHELTVRDRPAAHAIVRALGNQRDQVARLEIAVPYADPLIFAFEDASGDRRIDDHEHPLGRLSAGPMVRIVDLPRALQARGYGDDGELVLACTDGSSSESVRLSVQGGTARVEKGNHTSDLVVTRSALASMLAAGLRPLDAAALGLLRGSPSAVETAERLFAGPRFQCLDPF